MSLHELIPGHHFHIGRQLADAELPAFRRGDWHGAFTEGWGSYATWLGVESGIYDEDPYSRYGMYILEIFLATRLVVDTGMNVFGWTLEEGREYMREHTLESETQIATESLRYSADMPAQALAYQMGKLKFIELRERAEQALGEGFDVRRFHQAILENGSLPMSVLERHIDLIPLAPRAHVSSSYGTAAGRAGPEQWLAPARPTRSILSGGLWSLTINRTRIEYSPSTRRTAP